MLWGDDVVTDSMASDAAVGGKAGAPDASVLGKLRVSYSDAIPEVQEFAIEVAKTALAAHTKGGGGSKHFSDVAKAVRDEVAQKYKGTWHCIVGKGFGSMVTQETGK